LPQDSRSVTSTYQFRKLTGDSYAEGFDVGNSLNEILKLVWDVQLKIGYAYFNQFHCALSARLN